MGGVHRSRYADPVVPNLSLPAFVLERAADHPDHVALIDGLTGVTTTYGELLDRVDAAAARLDGAGVRPGDAVAIMAGNQPAWAVAFYAILRLGAAIVPLNPAFTADEVSSFLRLSRAKVILADVGAEPVAGEAAAERGGRLFPIVEIAAPGPAPAAPDRAGPGQAAVIAFSSGTTGLPKAVVLTHRNLVAAICQHAGIYHLDGDDVVLAALPLFHIYGLSIVLDYALRHGSTVVTLPRFSLERYLKLIAEHHVTWLHLAPPIALQLGGPGAAGADLSSVRHAVSGAAPLDAGVAAKAEAALGCRIGQGYGMTEASPGVTWVPDDGTVPCPPGSVGVLVAGTEARVVDPATGADTDGSGELWVRGPQVMAGYLDDPTATAATLVDGWLRTGDIVRIDDAGIVWVVDRLKELIKYKGFQVAPAELEGVILAHPAVVDVGVVGRPDIEAGELPVAWVVTSEPIEEQDLIDWVAARVAPYKKVRAVRFVDAIPRSPAGKILRRRLKEAG